MLLWCLKAKRVLWNSVPWRLTIFLRFHACDHVLQTACETGASGLSSARWCIQVVTLVAGKWAAVTSLTSWHDFPFRFCWHTLSKAVSWWHARHRSLLVLTENGLQRRVLYSHQSCNISTSLSFDVISSVNTHLFQSWQLLNYAFVATAHFYVISVYLCSLWACYFVADALTFLYWGKNRLFCLYFMHAYFNRVQYIVRGFWEMERHKVVLGCKM